MRCPFAIALLATALAACEQSIPAENYPGDPRILMRGEVTSGDTLRPSEVAIGWQTGAPPSMSTVAVGPRSGSPPIVTEEPSFELAVYDPPPEAALERLREGEPRVARALVVAVPHNHPDANIGGAMAEGDPAFGADVLHWLVYLESAALPGSLTAWWLGAQDVGVAAGYSILRITPFDGPCMSDEELAPCVAELVPGGAVPDVDTARGYCRAPYRLSPDPGALLSVRIGTYDLPSPAACPP